MEEIIEWAKFRRKKKNPEWWKKYFWRGGIAKNNLKSLIFYEKVPLYGEEEHDMIINSTIDNEARCKGKQKDQAEGEVIAFQEEWEKGQKGKKRNQCLNR